MKIIKTAEDFEKAVQEKNITHWTIRNCSMCDYPLSYIFKEGNVFFDSGCECVLNYSSLYQRTWEDVANIYNSQNNPTTIKWMNEFWGF